MWPWLKSNVSRSWYIKQCTPLGLHYSTWSKHGGKWRDKRGEKHCQVLPVFFFVNEHNNTNTKPQAKKQRFLKLSKKFPEEKQQLVEENDADNIRKVLCKSFIQRFWEWNLCCYKYRVDCLGSLRLFSCCCWSESLEYNKTLNVRSLGKPVNFVSPWVLMFPSTSSRETSGLPRKQN